MEDEVAGNALTTFLAESITLLYTDDDDI